MGKTITTYLIDGTPQGPRTVFISNKNLMALEVPRIKLASVMDRKEFKRCALYILIGESEYGEPKAYIGETNNFSNRVKNHEKNKDFWSKALVFVSQNDSQIDKADVQYLEAKAIRLADECKQFVLDENKQLPELPVLPEHKRDPDDEFFEDVVFVTSFTGCNIFEKAESKSSKGSKEEHLFYITGRGAKATAVYNDSGMVVLAGSILASGSTPSFKGADKRAKMIKECAQIENGNVVLKMNRQFSSPSGAACFCIGNSSNGMELWKDKNGVQLKEYLSKQ